jgi:hypothetical protein
LLALAVFVDVEYGEAVDAAVSEVPVVGQAADDGDGFGFIVVHQ